MKVDYMSELEKIILTSNTVRKAIERAQQLSVSDYYIGAGSIAQTVWNYLSDNDPDYGIKDIDFVYFDSKNLDYDSENAVISEVNTLFSDFKLKLDVKNQARIHLWYSSHFGYDIKPYESLEAAIDTWPTTASAIGVRMEMGSGGNSGLKVYAPFGLEDLFSKTVRANKAQITKQIYEKKVSDWILKWPDLKVIEWDG